MRQLYLEYSAAEFLEQLVQELKKTRRPSLAQALPEMPEATAVGHTPGSLCAEKDDVEVEFALKTKANPIGVAEYQLQARLPAELQGRLPTARQLADAVREAMPGK